MYHCACNSDWIKWGSPFFHLQIRTACLSTSSRKWLFKEKTLEIIVETTALLKTFQLIKYRFTLPLTIFRSWVDGKEINWNDAISPKCYTVRIFFVILTAWIMKKVFVRPSPSLSPELIWLHDAAMNCTQYDHYCTVFRSTPNCGKYQTATHFEWENS